YAQHRGCRHARIADYFGQEGAPRRCQACDNCLDLDRPPEEEVPMPQLRLALAAAARFNGRVGAANLAAVLGGKQTSWVRRQPWVLELSHFGALPWPEERLRLLISEMVEAGLMRQTPGEYPVLQLTALGARAARGQVDLSLSLPPATVAAAAAAARRGPAPADGSPPPHPALLEGLKRW